MNKGSDAGDMPREISRGEIEIGGITLEVVNLDNGQRVITAESLAKFVEAFGDWSALTKVEDTE